MEFDPSWPFIKNGQEKNWKSGFSSAKLINKFVPVNQKGTFLSRLHMCLKIARAIAFDCMQQVLAHSDLSYNNVSRLIHCQAMLASLIAMALSYA